MPKTTVGEPAALDVLVTLRLLRDASEGQVRRVLHEAIEEIERLRAAIHGESTDQDPQRARAGTHS